MNAKIKKTIIMTQTKWIRSKVVVFFGIEERFAGMFMVDSEEQAKAISDLIYGFPYYYRIYDDIPRLSLLEESLKIKVNEPDKTIEISFMDIDGIEKSIKKDMDGLDRAIYPYEKTEFIEKIENIFGN